MHDGMAAKQGRRRCMDDMDCLPEDVLHEVFSRVGSVKDLFMLALTCRRWLRRFTDPAFLRGVVCPDQGQLCTGHRARLLGFFFQHQHQQARCGERTVMNKQQRTSPTFLPAPGSPLGPTLSYGDDDDGTFNDAEPLAARRGIVLMQLVHRTFGTHLFGLCNPITGERHVLPPLQCSDNVAGYAIITAGDSDDVVDGTLLSGRFAFSQLLVLTSLSRDKVYLHSYSAATRSWSGPIKSSDRAGFLSLAGEKSAVVHRGAAHWLLIDHHDNLLYKLSVEVGGAVRKAVSLTKLPAVRVGGSPLLCVSRDGKLSVACVYLMHVAVWTQQEQDAAAAAAAWLRTVIRIPVAVPNPKYPPGKQPQEKWFDFHRGSMLVIHRSSGVFLLDLEKKGDGKGHGRLLAAPIQSYTG